MNISERVCYMLAICVKINHFETFETVFEPLRVNILVFVILAIKCQKNIKITYAGVD